jgi:hypothetical protein
LDPWGRRARDDKETTTTSSPLDGIGCWTHEVIAHCAGFFGEPGVSSENRTWRSSENLEDLDKPAGDHLKTCCWRSSENLEDLFICQKGNEIRRDQTLNQPNKPWHMILSSCEPTEYPSPLLRHRPVERDMRTQYGLPRLITRIIDGTQVRGPLSSSLEWFD